MLSQEMCKKIWACHREIETGKSLLIEVEKIINANEERQRTQAHGEALSLKDAFGRSQGLQLGIPSGDNCHQLLNMSYDLAKPVIKTHISNKEAELAELNEMAKLEIG